MNNWIPSNRSLTFVVSGAVLSILLYSASLGLLFNHIKRIERFYSGAESGFAKAAKARAIRSAALDNQENLAVLRNFFVQRGDEVQFIEHIEQLGRNFGLEFAITSIAADPKDDSPIKENIEIGVSVQGSWSGVMNFIDKLEKSHFGVLVKETQLDRVGAGVWSGDFEIVVFREK